LARWENTLSGSPAEDAIRHEVFYEHPIERVWQALTDRRKLACWLMETDFEPELGRAFEFHDHNLNVPDNTGVISCRVVELDPPRRLAYTWAGPPTLRSTLVTWTLDPTPAGTRVVLVHSGFASAGPSGPTIRDYLEWGWGGLLAEELPELLAGLRQGPAQSPPRPPARGPASTSGLD
jgi:uncharacterized protein YndB with AHSA1/START domain